MTENVPPGSATKGNAPVDSTARGLPYYEKLRRDLRDTIQKKRILDKNIATLEETIYRHESAYLEETCAAGNIIKGFDNYIKSSTVAPASATGAGSGTISGSAAGGGSGAGRRRTAVNEMDRVFSRSSAGYMRDSNSPSSAHTTPNHVATPAGSFAPGVGENRSGNNSATASVKGVGDKKKKKTAVATEESETDAKPTKRQKISYGRDEP